VLSPSGLATPGGALPDGEQLALPPPDPLTSYDEDLPSDAEVVPLGPRRQITAGSSAGSGR